MTFARVRLWNVGVKSIDTCCPSFALALKMGTDNEGWGTLISHVDGAWAIGSADMPTINFCPWCAEDVTGPPKIVNKEAKS